MLEVRVARRDRPADRKCPACALPGCRYEAHANVGEAAEGIGEGSEYDIERCDIANEAPVIRLVNQIISRGSSVAHPTHIEPERRGCGPISN
jgi:hypothetical protein